MAATKVEKMGLAELRHHIDIDLNNLDNEILAQPGLFQASAEGFAQAAGLLLQIKNSLEVTEAELKLNARKGFAMSGEKATEGKVDETVQSSAEMKELYKLHEEAEINYNEWHGVRRAYEHRLEMLKIYSSMLDKGLKQFARS
jgi:hypothetical protein